MTRTLLLIGLVNIALAASCFTVIYMFTARWWKSPMGVNIMLLVGGLAAVTDLALVYNIIDRPEWALYVFAAFYFAIGGAIWWRLVMLWRAQFPARREP